MTVPMPRLLRQACWALVIAFPLLVLIGERWQQAAAGPGTRGVMAVAAVICPAAVEPVLAMRVADGAHALDGAVLRRIAMQLYIGPGCSVPVEPPVVRADRRRDRGGGKKMRGMGKSM
ncbi:MULTISPECIES: hypothetical protein [unclassified Sphingomonas]|uniref:hypothetical protein n=1 Tax=unclassified Sphingomonas TaxID=196159 RepID=UPI00285E9041|nr:MULTISPECIES: hypothetical protein [unclassified Sphingomonas]MDR6116036.1 hypothetical protein [Sphingomonas sp. SORGH_AS_0789]MDR6150291.1 hypothetical protein [Sphingomonas sp. SORGH_AS_0742]